MTFSQSCGTLRFHGASIISNVVYFKRVLYSSCACEYRHGTDTNARGYINFYANKENDDGGGGDGGGGDDSEDNRTAH